MSRITASGRFIYAGPYKTRDKAELSLEEEYSLGNVCDGEDPQIERVVDHHKRLIGYVVTLPI